MRKHLLEYDDVMNQQREVVYDRRRDALERDDISDQVREAIGEVVDDLIDSHTDEKTDPEEWDLEGLQGELRGIFLIGFTPPEREEMTRLTRHSLRDWIMKVINLAYKRREEMVGSGRFRKLEKAVVLSIIDDRWREHLYEMDQLKEGIGLRSYGQKDPLIEYKNEGFKSFVEMLKQTNREILRLLFRISAQEAAAPPPPVRRRRSLAADTRMIYQDTTGMGFATSAISESPAPHALKANAPAEHEPIRPVHVGPKIGRNDLCPCGSGKKYKKCHGKNV
jgi:preprotein translocase subunit SecA